MERPRREIFGSGLRGRSGAGVGLVRGTDRRKQEADAVLFGRRSDESDSSPMNDA